MMASETIYFLFILYYMFQQVGRLPCQWLGFKQNEKILQSEVILLLLLSG